MSYQPLYKPVLLQSSGEITITLIYIFIYNIFSINITLLYQKLTDGGKEKEGNGFARCQLKTANWSQILQEFSCRELSFETDKLPALSGIAEHWPRSIEHKYLAGLWEDNLMFDLTWKHEVALYGNKIPLSVPTNYRAPTWSWASVDGNIKYNCVLEQFQPWSTLISSNIVLKNPASPFGEVLSGSITLRGRVLSGRADLKNMEVVLSDGIRCGAWIDQRIRKERVSLSHDMVSNNIKAMAINEGSTSKEEKGTLVNCLVLGVWNGNKPLWYAMILRRVKAREGVFERIGILVWVGSLPGIKGVKDTNVTVI